MNAVVPSLSYDQEEILLGILRLLDLPRFEVDITYGNGLFYTRTVPEPSKKFDIDPQKPDVKIADSGSLPIEDHSVGSVVFDPPFLTYVKRGRTGNGKMIMAQRFGGYWRYDELVEHYFRTMKEVSRILKKGGYLIMKCQDIVHNHRIHPTHVWAIQWAEENGLYLKDLFVLGGKNKLPSPTRNGVQRHARISHSYFLVFKAA